MKWDYTRKGDYLFPNLTLTDEPMQIGKYRMLRKSFLKAHRKNWYQSMLLSGKLEKHLLEVEQAADERMQLLTAQMAERENVTEELKAENPMLWVAKMNSIQNRAEETVLSELVYA